MTVGIICEYNPLHLGHQKQIRKIREVFGEETAIVCAMSGNFVQRGECAIMEKHARAEAALRGGADLVLELPLPWATASAERFAAGGVGVLAATGLVDTLVFGSECGDTARLMTLAEGLLSAQFPVMLKEQLAKGVSYAAARAAAAEKLLGADAALLENPNDILGVEYCKALLCQGSAITPMALPRRGAAHDGAAKDGFASASTIRTILRNGESADVYLTEESADIYRRERAVGRAPVDMQSLERCILSRLRSMKEDDFAAYDGGGEGLYHRFYDAVQRARSVEEVLGLAKTKRYAHARLRRMLLAAWLDIPAETFREIGYLHVLGFTERGRELLAAMKKRAQLPVITKSAEGRNLPSPARELFELEARATDQYVLAYPDLGEALPGSEWLRGPVIV